MKRNRESIKLSPRKYDLAGLPTSFFMKGELEALLYLIETVKPKTIIEFGVNNGRTPVAVLRNVIGVERYVGIDVEPEYKTIMQVQRGEVPKKPGELALHDPRFELIVKKNGSFDLTAGDLPEADAIFIDADHSRKGVLNDYALAKAKIKKGGIVIFHDDNCLPVVQVTETLNDLCAAGANIKHVAGTWLSFERF